MVQPKPELKNLCDSSKLAHGPTSRTRIIMMRLWALACLTVLVIGCAYYRDQYLDEARGRATKEEIMQKWGPPMEKRPLDTGESMWLYRFKRYSTQQRTTICDVFELRFDRQRVLQHWDGGEVDCFVENM
jgi:hypothetical protein